MRLARYVGQGRVEIVDEPAPACPKGGLLVQTEACGLCSGELMAWYMDRKIPHVLGHEVAGRVVESQDDRFPVGTRVFPHHHAPCLACDLCRAGKHVHCPQWRSTKLVPGGMAELFAVPAANLNDTWGVDDLRAEDAALVEPLACVAKSVRMGAPGSALVVGLGVMGLMHLAALGAGAVGVDLLGSRVEWARAQGWTAHLPEGLEGRFETVYVCPGSQAAFELALDHLVPGGMVVMFAPLPPDEALRVPQAAYFQDLALRHAYSCGPDDTAQALAWLRAGKLRAEQVVSHFVPLADLPAAYVRMRSAEILKAMVLF